MPSNSTTLERELAGMFVSYNPREAALALEAMPLGSLVEHLEQEPESRAAAVLEQIAPDAAAQSISLMKDEPTRRVLPAMNPALLAPILARLDDDVRNQNLALLDEDLAQELQAIMAYPPNTAGHLMDPRFSIYRPDTKVREVTGKLRLLRKKQILDLVLVDYENRLLGLLSLRDVILAEPATPLGDLLRGDPPAINAMSPREDVVELLQQGRLTTLPVVDADRHVVGVIRYDSLVQAVREEASADMQAMVGVSRDEHALSSPWVSVRKRLPWLNINLLTAFLAAAVVGLFEKTIAQVTALAILLPVVAGQSGNTGAQALAVTMRGLALREVRLRQWPKLIVKEATAGMLNGIAVAIVTALGVLVWSRSMGLCLVIGVAMVMSMAIAGTAGAAIPMLLTSLRQDPAQSSSIILTTVTDVMGFLSFLGLATIFVSYL